jgi:hypothetical protein
MIISPETKDLLEALSYLATVIGIPVAIIAFIAEKRKDRRERERDAYIEANARYIDYLTLCFEHPELDAFDLSEQAPDVRESGLDVKKLALFTILISILETGYILYADQRENARLRQWQGWHDYMVMWARRADFRKAWPLLGPQFDTEFVQHMEKIIRETEQPTAA